MEEEYEDLFYLIAASICECFKERKNPTNSDIIYKTFDLAEKYEHLLINAGIEEKHDITFFRIPHNVRPGTRELISSYNQIHSYLDNMTKYIKENEPDFRISELSKIKFIKLSNSGSNREKKKNTDITYYKEPERFSPVFIQGLASKSSSLYKFRKSNMYDSNINRIICEFLGEKPKKIPDNFYKFNQCIEFGLKFPHLKAKLINATLVYLLLARS